ncbi:MAG: hypothetical protein ACREQ3_26390, partial [Candidatus Binatia bacterium]
VFHRRFDDWGGEGVMTLTPQPHWTPHPNPSPCAQGEGLFVGCLGGVEDVKDVEDPKDPEDHTRFQVTSSVVIFPHRATL